MRIPFTITFHFDDNLRDVPDDPAQLARAITWVCAELDRVTDDRDRLWLAGRCGVWMRVAGDLTGAEEVLRGAVSQARMLGDQCARVANTIRLAHVVQWCGRFAECDAMFADAIQQCECLPDCAPLLSFACQHAGKSFFEQGRYHQAVAMFSRALTLREQDGAAELIESSRMALDAARMRGG